MKNILVLAVLLIGIAIPKLNAQNHSFQVLAIKGEIKVKAAGAKWEVLKTGARLNDGDRIKLSDNNYLGLVYSGGKTLELRANGTYNVSELAANLKASQSSIVSKYADFVVSKMTPEVIEENRKKYASVTGAGERGIYDTDIHVLLPRSGALLNNTANLNWVYTEADAVYVIEIKNIFGETLLVEESVFPSYLVDFDRKQIVEGCIDDIIAIEVRLKSDESVKSQEVAIRLLNKKEGKKVLRDVSMLESMLEAKSALNSIIMAEFYEQEGLVLDAINSYESAISLSPDVSYFQAVYDEFLIRNQLKRPVTVKNEQVE